MGRSLLLAETIINGQVVVISTSHLESLDTAEYRKKQMDIAFPILKQFKNSMLMGDFNFDSRWPNEQAGIDPNFDDIYLTLNHGVESFTMPADEYFSASRLDKIVVNKSSYFKPETINIIGRFPIPSFSGQDIMLVEQDRKVRTPSDHYGLYATF